MKTIRLTDEQYEQVLEAIKFACLWANYDVATSYSQCPLWCNYECKDFFNLYKAIMGLDE